MTKDTIENKSSTKVSSSKSKKSSYSKKDNFHEIDGSENIVEITRKIDTFVNV